MSSNNVKNRLVVAIFNLSRKTCTLFLTSIFEFLHPQKIMKFMRGSHFEFPWNLEKITAHLHIVGNVIVKFE